MTGITTKITTTTAETIVKHNIAANKSNWQQKREIVPDKAHGGAVGGCGGGVV